MRLGAGEVTGQQWHVPQAGNKDMNWEPQARTVETDMMLMANVRRRVKIRTTF